MPKIVNYTVENLETGESYTGRADVLSTKVNYCKTGFARAYRNEWLIHGVWKVTKRYEEAFEPNHTNTHMYDWLTEKNMRHLDKHKIKALWESYTSGRSDYWTIPRIADECGVPQEAIKKVLKLV